MKYEMSEEDAKLLIKIYKSKGKTLFFVSGMYQIAYTTLYNKVQILMEMGLIKLRKNRIDRKKIYYVEQEIFEQAILLMNPTIGDDNDSIHERTNNIQTNS